MGQQYCLQAAINADAGQYNFPGFDLGSIEIEVSNGGCVVDQGSKQLVCSPGSISYSKKPASLNGFSKNGMNYQGSYCPAMTFPKKKRPHTLPPSEERRVPCSTSRIITQARASKAD